MKQGEKIIMKPISKRIFALICAVFAALVIFCSCGSDLDGTWTSQSDPNTKLHFSGDKVKVTYDDFKINGSYESDDTGNIIITLTDPNGNIFKITAELSMSDEKTIKLKNLDGEIEVFKK